MGLFTSIGLLIVSCMKSIILFPVCMVLCYATYNTRSDSTCMRCTTISDQAYLMIWITYETITDSSSVRTFKPYLTRDLKTSIQSVILST